jgi:hypothetical protein
MMNFSNKNPASCFIELEPDQYKDGSWSGGLKINILTSKDNPMPEESVKSLLHLSQLVASTVALMEQDTLLADKLEKFVTEPEEENKLEVVSREGNVINLNFKTTTQGEA